MLFYNENDEICLKHKDDSYTVVRELDYFKLEGEWYRYSNNYFYEALECDGDLDTYWERRIHVRHMNIVEMEEVFKDNKKDKTDDEIIEWRGFND